MSEVFGDAGVLAEGAELGHQPEIGWPLRWWRWVPSVIMPAWNVPAPRSHRFWRPVEQYRQRPQLGMKLADTWSPGLTLVHARPDLDHDARALVATDDREESRMPIAAMFVRRHHVARDQVFVGVAHARRPSTARAPRRPWVGRRRSPRSSSPGSSPHSTAALDFMVVSSDRSWLSVVLEHAADGLAVSHVVVAVVHAVERVRLGDQTVQIELAFAIQTEQLGDVGTRVTRTEQRADDLLLHQGQVEQADVGAVSPSAGWMLVTTTRPRLAASANASPMTAPDPTPMVMMTLLAMVPQVRSVISGRASAMLAAVWVAPNSMAFSRLNSTGSIAMIRLAPASRAPWIAFEPMPPTPTTATVSPGLTSAAYTAAAPAGDDTAAEQAGPVERHVVVDLDAAGLVDHRVMGEGAEQTHQPHILALGVVAAGAVGDLTAEAQQRPEVAQVLSGRWSSSGNGRSSG